MATQTENPLEQALAKEIGAGYNATAGLILTVGITDILEDALKVDREDILPEATIVGGLGAESIDGLDLSFKIERYLGIRLGLHHHNLLYSPIPGTNLEEQQTVVGLVKFLYEFQRDNKGVSN